MIEQLGTTQNGDYDLAAGAAVLDSIPSTTLPKLVQAVLYLGDGVKNLDGTGGNFLYRCLLADRSGPLLTVTFIATTTAANFWTEPLSVPANTSFTVFLQSPNAADSDVDVTAMLYELDVVDSGLEINIGNIEDTLDALEQQVGGLEVVSAELTEEVRLGSPA